MPVEGYIKKKQTENSSNSSYSNRAVDKSSDFMAVKLDLVNKVRERIIEKYTTDDMNDTSKLDVITKDALNMIEEESANTQGSTLLDSREKGHILEKLLNNMFGYGVIDPLIKDVSITEIMVNGLDQIFIEKGGKIVIATNEKGENLAFDTPEELMYVVDKIVSPINRKIDDSNPICDARLPNGFRVNIVLNTISLDGTIITIRKFPDSPLTMDKLVDRGALPPEVADFLMKLIKARYNLFVSGGTGSGKTTFLNALSNFINKDERVITIEDAAELKIQGVKNLIRLETRPANVEGKGAITMRDLLKSALRMRPDRIVVGEVRTGEALEMLQAMNTGHDGSLSTGHANTAADMLARLETMVMMSGMELPLLSIRQQISTAIEVIVHLGKLRDGSRKVLQITEILGVDQNSNYITSDLFKFDSDKNKLLYTGNKLKQTSKLKFAANSKNDGELGRAVIASSFTFPNSTNQDSDASDSENSGSSTNQISGLFERFLKTKASAEQNFKTNSSAPAPRQESVNVSQTPKQVMPQPQVQNNQPRQPVAAPQQQKPQQQVNPQVNQDQGFQQRPNPVQESLSQVQQRPYQQQQRPNNQQQGTPVSGPVNSIQNIPNQRMPSQQLVTNNVNPNQRTVSQGQGPINREPINNTQTQIQFSNVPFAPPSNGLPPVGRKDEEQTQFRKQLIDISIEGDEINTYESNDFRSTSPNGYNFDNFNEFDEDFEDDRPGAFEELEYKDNYDDEAFDEATLQAGIQESAGHNFNTAKSTAINPNSQNSGGNTGSANSNSQRNGNIGSANSNSQRNGNTGAANGNSQRNEGQGITDNSSVRLCKLEQDSEDENSTNNTMFNIRKLIQ